MFSCLNYEFQKWNLPFDDLDQSTIISMYKLMMKLKQIVPDQTAPVGAAV